MDLVAVNKGGKSGKYNTRNVYETHNSNRFFFRLRSRAVNTKKHKIEHSKHFPFEIFTVSESVGRMGVVSGD